MVVDGAPKGITRIEKGDAVRRHLRKALFGLGFVFLISPEECVFNYCVRHNFNPPICDGFNGGPF